MLPLRLSFLRSVRNLLTSKTTPRPRPAAPLARVSLRCEALEGRAVPASVSSFASAVSVASPVNASGTTDLVTISVRDTDGQPVSGLTTEDFAFSLLGQLFPSNGNFPFSLAPGASTGTFGPVSEAGTSGTYFTHFTGVTAGSSVGFAVSVEGTPLSSFPTVQVTPGAVSASNSTVSLGSSFLFLPAQNAITINVADAAGNAITGLPSSAFQFSVSGGPLISTFSPVTEIGTSGTYTTTLTADSFFLLSSASRTLTVSVEGTQLGNQPGFAVTKTGRGLVDPPPPGTPIDRGAPAFVGGGGSGSTPIPQLATTVFFDTPTVASGMSNPVTIVVRDTAGNAKSGLMSADFTLSLSGGTSTGGFGPVTPTTTPGVYTTLFTGHTAGTALTLRVEVGGVLLNSQPTIRVTPGAVSATASAVSFAPAARGAGVVAINLKDAAGNAVTGLPDTAFQLGLSGGTSTGTFGPMTEVGSSGVYTSAFTGTAVGTPSTLTATADGVPLSGQTAVEVTSLPPDPVPPAVATIVPAAPPAAAPAPPAEPLYTGAFVVGNLLVVQGRGVPGGTAVLALPPGSAALFADADGDGRRDVVLLLPRLAVVLDAATGQVRAIPF